MGVRVSIACLVIILLHGKLVFCTTLGNDQLSSSSSSFSDEIVLKCNCQKFKGYHQSSKDVDLNGPFDYARYQPFEKIERELFRITNQSKSSQVFSIGKTFENRSLWIIKFSRKAKSLIRTEKRRMIVVDCGAHAREWIAPSTCMYLIKMFSKSVDSVLQTKFVHLMDKFDWIFIPLLNPDGYAYSWHNKTTRLWRKNRSFTKEQADLKRKTNDELCIGVDINRNFDKVWGGIGAPVKNPCYEMYAGPTAFSERESLALAKFVNSTKRDVIAYVSLHNFGQNWMTPWGFTKKLPDNYKEMLRVADIAVKAMYNFSGIKYTTGSSYRNLYPNSGNSADWAYDVANIPYSYTVEMMPSEGKVEHSFLVPPKCMVKNAKDIFVGLKAMAEAIIL